MPYDIHQIEMTKTIPRPELARFARHMEAKLRENDGKRHWGNCDVGYLRRRLRTETRELFALLDRERRRPARMSAETAREIAREAADVANFAMMIADNAERTAEMEAVDG